jgi:hypothetical protein
LHPPTETAANRRPGIGAVLVASFGIWLLWSQYSTLATLSRWYDSTQYLRAGTKLPAPDYDLGSLQWQTVHPRVFDVAPGRLTLVTDGEPFAYQAFAIVNTDGANAAGIQFEAEIESGGTTIGLLQAGKWIAVSSSQRPGVFAETASAQLGYGRSIMVMIANNNPSGETRLTVKSLRLYLRK